MGGDVEVPVPDPDSDSDSDSDWYLGPWFNSWAIVVTNVKTYRVKKGSFNGYVDPLKCLPSGYWICWRGRLSTVEVKV